jgi:hypothetical protein
LRRYGPIAAIVVVILVVAGVVIATRSNDNNKSSSNANTAANTQTGSYHPAGVLTWDQAKAEGKTKSIDWGSRCDTSRGTLAYPSFFAGPCYAPFKGNNGGATSTGVTSDSIKIVYYQAQDNDPILAYITGAIGDTDTNAQTQSVLRDWVKFFEHYSELYGRKVDLVFYTATGNASDEVAARADATQIVEQYHPFAVLGGPVLTAAFGQQLIADKTLCIACMPGQPNDFYKKSSPYVIGLATNPDEGQLHVASYVGRRLANRKAQYAGDSSMHNENRKFGEIYISTGQDAETQQKHLEESLAGYGVHLAKVLAYTSPTTLSTDAPGLIAQLKSAGVTSVLLVTDPVAPGPITRAATSQGYHPEWIITGAPLTDTAIFARTYDQDQWKHAFGLSFLAARTDPSVSGYTYLYKWWTGHNPETQTGSPVAVAPLNLFYSLIQAVGPDVTPANFIAASFSAPATPEAVTQPGISFGNKGRWPFKDDYLGIDDATEVWWNPTPKGPDEINHDGTGLYEFVDGGKRYFYNTWPKTAPKVFTTDGAVTIYKTVPPGEQVPSYPSPAGTN